MERHGTITLITFLILRGEMHDLFDHIEKSKDSSSFKPLLKAI